MTTRTLPQNYCQDVTDHLVHTVTFGPNALPLFRCPGRHTPSLHRMPKVGPKPGWTADDPFAGIDESEL